MIRLVKFESVGYPGLYPSPVAINPNSVTVVEEWLWYEGPGDRKPRVGSHIKHQMGQSHGYIFVKETIDEVIALLAGDSPPGEKTS